MKLISCHIEGFGKWVDKDIDFTDGINSFFMNNGEGKTTLAAFIRAMLYGLSEYTEKTKDFVARKHYAPFSRKKKERRRAKGLLQWHSYRRAWRRSDR